MTSDRNKAYRARKRRAGLVRVDRWVSKHPEVRARGERALAAMKALVEASPSTLSMKDGPVFVLAPQTIRDVLVYFGKLK